MCMLPESIYLNNKTNEFNNKMNWSSLAMTFSHLHRSN